jgi:tight adherence protein B
MDLQLIIPSVAVFLTVVCGALGLILVIGGYFKKRVRDRLQDVIALGDDYNHAKTVILRDMNLSTIPFLNEVLKHAGWARRLDTLLVQGDIPLRLGSFVASMLLLGAAGMYLTAFIFEKPLFALPVGLLLAFIPVFYARNRKSKRIRQFEKQFPDALDMLTNALRAGMALSGAIQVVAEESPDPVGKEFAILYEENRLGLDTKEALRKMAERVDSAEVHLFVTAVIMHRETGGNLAEILEGTAEVIRDRFRILGDVRSMTGQARLSGLILTVLPLVIAAIVMVVVPDYLKDFISDPMGRYFIVLAVLLQIVGFFMMRRIVNIKV